LTTPRSPIQGLTDLAELLGKEQPRVSKFVRGLAVGALVGAAIAGSTIWQRRRRQQQKAAEAEAREEGTQKG
jgi:hypothetical protein